MPGRALSPLAAPDRARRSTRGRRALGALALVALAGCVSATRPDGGEGLLSVGSALPDLEGLDQHGRTRRLAAERGKVLVVYFYPKDGTPGCTKEACAFRDAWESFRQRGVRVFGVSSDDARSHAEFAKEERLPEDLVLVADPAGVWARAFGVSTFLGMTERVSFLVDRRGRVAKVYPDIDPALHARQVLADASALGEEREKTRGAPPGLVSP